MSFVDMKRISDVQQKRMNDKRNLREFSPTAKKIKLKRTKEELKALVEEARKKSGIAYGDPNKV